MTFASLLCVSVQQQAYWKIDVSTGNWKAEFLIFPPSILQVLFGGQDLLFQKEFFFFFKILTRNTFDLSMENTSFV